MIEETEDRIIFSLDNKRFSVRYRLVIIFKGVQAYCLLPRTIIFSLRMNKGCLCEEEIRLAGDIVRGDNESDMSPEESSRFIKARIDVVVCATITVALAIAIIVVIEAVVDIDQRRLFTLPIRIILKFYSGVEHGDRAAAKIRSH